MEILLLLLGLGGGIVISSLVAPSELVKVAEFTIDVDLTSQELEDLVDDLTSRRICVKLDAESFPVVTISTLRDDERAATLAIEQFRTRIF